jgi:peptide/nickel transport system substrate-binding protein
MRRRLFQYSLVVFWVNVMIVSVFSFAFAGEPRYGGTLRIGVYARQDTKLDPRYTSVSAYFPAPYMIHDGILEWGKKGFKEAAPKLAISWETEDNKVWVFHLRKGVKFHNGREMTADDVKTNLDWIIETPKGWKPAARRGSFSDIEKVEVIDKYTVKVSLKRPFGPFPRILANDFYGLIAPEEAIKWGDQLTLHPVGTGPFKAVDITPEKVVLERFEDYWGPKPYLDRVEYVFIRSDEARLIALQKGELDIAHLGQAALPIVEEDPNLIPHNIVVQDSLNRLFFNFRRWPMNDIRFRKAVWMGANWKQIARNAHPLQLGEQARTFLEHSPFFNPEALQLVPPYNPGEAKKLIQNVEKDAGKKIPPIYYLDTDASIRRSIAEMAKIQLASIEVPLDPHNLPRGVYTEKLRADPKIEWDLGQTGIGFGAEPYIGYSYYMTDSGAGADGKSLGGYSNPEFDRWIGKAIAALKAEERVRCYQEAEKVLLKDVAGIPLVPTKFLVAHHKKVKGFVESPVVNIIVASSWANMWIDQ